MRQLSDCSDVRNQGLCIHCGEALEEAGYQQRARSDPKPSGSPPPDNLPVVYACQRCNSGSLMTRPTWSP